MIGVFDSGIGGLSILRALRAELPEESFIYVADSGHAPYGERDAAHVQARARALTSDLLGRGIRALVVACNTATAAAIELLRAEHPHLPIIGVEPALKPAVALSRSGCIGVMATRGTLGSDKFQRLLASLQGQADVVLQPCDGLASAIEASIDGRPESAQHLRELSTRHVQALQKACGARTMDTVVLGCTHYPLVQPLLADLLGPGVSLLDPGQAVARHTRSRLAGLSVAGTAGHASTAAGMPVGLQLLSTGDPGLLESAARRWIHPQARAQALHTG